MSDTIVKKEFINDEWKEITYTKTSEATISNETLASDAVKLAILSVDSVLIGSENQDAKVSQMVSKAVTNLQNSGIL